MPEFPVDVVYVIPGGHMESITLEMDSECIDLGSSYADGAYLIQHAGCFDNHHRGMPVDEIWSVEVSGTATTANELEAMTWIGHPGMRIASDENE